MLRALIFDVDGTLAETEELHRQAFNQAFTEAGLGWRWDVPLYAKLLDITGGKERMAYFQRNYLSARQLDTAALASLHAAKTLIYTDLATRCVTLRPGVERLLTEAEASGVRLAIATTTSRANVDALLAATLGRNPFEVIAAGDEVAAKKPEPDVYLLALQRLNLPASFCIALEDTKNGVRSAVAAGIECVVTMSIYGGQGPFLGASAVVPGLEDLDISFFFSKKNQKTFSNTQTNSFNSEF